MLIIFVNTIYEDKMRIVYLKQIVDDLIRHKVKVAILISVFVILMGGLGYYKAGKDVDENIVREITEYENVLEDYEDVIAELEESISLVERQIEELGEYCTKSVYMQMDSQKIAVAEVQYSIQTAYNASYIMSALSMYVNEGSFRTQIAEEDSEIAEEYLKELISCSASGNVFQVSVMAPQQEQASRLLSVIKQQLQEQKTQIESVQGAFVMQEIDATEYMKADTTVLNAQNANWNNLKNYKSNLSDLKKRLVDQKLNRKSYIEDNKPEIPEQESRIKIILKFIIFGIIVGVLLPMAWFGLKYIMGNTIKGQEELLIAGIPVLGVFNAKKEYDLELALAVLDIQMLAEKQKCEQIVINNLTDDEDTRRIISSCTESLEKEKLSVVNGVNIQRDIGKLRQMVAVGHCLLVVKVGKTSYSQVEEQVQLAQKFSISIWGCILVG